MLSATRLFGLLPDDQKNRCLALWNEFETGQSIDAKFARTVDRLQPILLNMQTEGGTWIDFHVTLDQLIARTQHMQKGSDRLWTITQELYNIASQQGWLNDKT